MISVPGLRDSCKSTILELFKDLNVICINFVLVNQKNELRFEFG